MQLKFSEQLNTRLELVHSALAALFMGVSGMACLIRAFHLSWSPGSAFSGRPDTGLLSCWNQIAAALGRTQYILLPRFSGGFAGDGSLLPQGTFLTMLGVLAVVIAFLLIQSRIRWLLLIPVVLLLGLLFVTEEAPSAEAAALLAFSMALAYAVMGSSPRRGQWGLLVPALALVLCLGVSAAISSTITFAPIPPVKKASAAIQNLLDRRYGTDPLGKGDLSRLSGKDLARQRGSIGKVIASLKGGADESDAALVLSSEKMEPCYLRGFVGEQYNGRSWSPLTDSAYYTQRDDLYWLNKQGFDGLSQLAQAAGLSGETPEEKTLSVKVKKADASVLYVPYECTGTAESLPAGSQSLAGGALRSSRFLGTREYEIPWAGNLTGAWTDWVGKLYSRENKADLEGYFTSESHYNVWCYEQDTGISQKMTDLLYGEIGDPGDISREHAPYKETIEKIRDYLGSKYIYSENFKSLPAGEDFLESFIKSRKGCDVHYASLATELFRYFGIPARYVEGYLVSPADAEKGGEVTIGRSHCHAWTEVYIDGYGWVPLEVTPVYQGILPEADMSKGLQAVAYESEQPKDPAPVPEEETSEEEAPDYSGMLLRAAVIGLLILGALLLLWLMYRLIRLAISAYRLRKDFTHEDPRHGVCAMYGYMLDQKIPVSETAEVIGNTAAFSRGTIREQHRTIMRQELEKGKDEKRKNKKTRSRASGTAFGLHGLRRRRRSTAE